MAESTQLYRQIMAQLEAKRIELGVSMKKLDDMAGIPDHYYSKCLFPNTPSGRRAGWHVLDEIVNALFGRHFSVKLELNAGDAANLMPNTLGSERVDARYLQQRHWRHVRHFRVIGAKGGRAVALKMTPIQRKKRASRAARKRWQIHNSKTRQA